MTILDDDDFYPESDGKPFDSDWHFNVFASVRRQLKERYEHEPNVYISGWLFIYFERGNPQQRIAPDIFLVRGVPKRNRRHFLVWNEQATPNVVIEVTSRQTRDEDWSTKLPIYRDVLRVPEVFFFDPCCEYLSPNLQGVRFSDQKTMPIAADEDGGIWSEELGVTLRPDGTNLLLVDPLPTERDKREAVEAENARLKAEIAALRGSEI